MNYKKISHKAHQLKNMFEIRIKGRNDTIEVTDEQGGYLKTDWEKYLENRVDSLVEVGTWTGRLSDIRDMKRIQNPASRDTRVQDYQRENRLALERIRALSPEVRAERLGFFKLVFYTYTGTVADEKTLTKAREIQKDFFTQRPKRTVCDPLLFKRLLPKEKYRREMNATKELRRLPIVQGALNTITETVRQDIFAEKKIV